MILEKGLSNVLIIVTRYFGGILLGTGGLVRAYSLAAEKSLENISIIEKTKGYQAKIQIEYSDLEALKYYLKKNNVKILNIEYLEKIEVEVEITEEISEQIINNYNIANIKILNYKKLIEKFVEI